MGDATTAEGPRRFTRRTILRGAILGGAAATGAAIGLNLPKLPSAEEKAREIGKRVKDNLADKTRSFEKAAHELGRTQPDFGKYLKINPDGSKEATETPQLVPITFEQTTPAPVHLYREPQEIDPAAKEQNEFPVVSVEQLNRNVHWGARILGAPYGRSPDIQGDFQLNGYNYGTWFKLVSQDGTPIDDKGIRAPEAPRFVKTNSVTVIK